MNNVLYHLHPVKVKRHGLKLTYTFCLGGLSFFLFILLTITGIFLMFFYRPHGRHRRRAGLHRHAEHPHVGVLRRPRPQPAPVGRPPDGLQRDAAHGARLLHGRLQAAARVQLGGRRDPAVPHARPVVHRLPAAVGPARDLGGHGGHVARGLLAVHRQAGELPAARRRGRRAGDACCAGTSCTCWRCRSCWCSSSRSTSGGSARTAASRDRSEETTGGRHGHAKTLRSTRRSSTDARGRARQGHRPRVAEGRARSAAVRAYRQAQPRGGGQPEAAARRPPAAAAGGTGGGAAAAAAAAAAPARRRRPVLPPPWRPAAVTTPVREAPLPTGNVPDAQEGRRRQAPAARAGAAGGHPARRARAGRPRQRLAPPADRRVRRDVRPARPAW